MNEVETDSVTDQPATGEVETESYPGDSLPSDSPAEVTPDTQTADEPVETEPEGESEAAETPEASETETPSPDEFLASLTREEIAYYAKRYPTLYKAYQDQNQPADLRQAFIDRVNQDHAYAELRDSQGTEEDGEPSSETVPPANTEETTKQYYAQIDDIVSKQIDPARMSELGTNLLAAMGVDLKSADPDIQAIVKNAPQVGKVLAHGAIDLIATVLPNLIGSRLESAMPGITEMYYDNLYARTWEGLRTRSVKLPDGTSSQPYAKLPAMGTPQWNSAIDSVLKEMPELREMFSELPPGERIAKQYAIAAKLMTGQRVNPAVVAAAVDTGKKLARTASVQRAAGKALGSGRSTQQLGAKTDDEDPVMADLDRAIEQANQADRPLTRKKA